MIESSLVDKIKVNRGHCLKFTSPSMTGIPDRIILLLKGKIEIIETKRPGREPKAIRKRIRPLNKIFKIYVLDFKENIDEIIKRIEDDNLEYTLHKYQNYLTELIKDLFLDAFAISKDLIIVPLRDARYTWKEEISGWYHPDILKY